MMMVLLPPQLQAADKITRSVLSDGRVLAVEAHLGEKEVKFEFRFPEVVSAYKLEPFMEGKSVFVAAKPNNGSDWYWGIAYCGDNGSIHVGITRWRESPPKDASLLGIGMPGGDSVVIYASRFVRSSANANEITSYAYVNHCPAPIGGRDLGGHLYSGEIGGSYLHPKADLPPVPVAE